MTQNVLTVSEVKVGDENARSTGAAYAVDPRGQDIPIWWTAVGPRGYGYTDQPYAESQYGGAVPPDFLGWEIEVAIYDGGDGTFPGDPVVGTLHPIRRYSVPPRQMTFVWTEVENVAAAAVHGLGFQSVVQFTVRGVTSRGRSAASSVTSTKYSGTSRAPGYLKWYTPKWHHRGVIIRCVGDDYIPMDVYRGNAGATNNLAQFRSETGALIGGHVTKDGAWSSITHIVDVNITSPNDQDILVYDSASGQWVNEYHDRMFVRVKNDTAGAFTKGQAVYVSGPHNANVVDVELADASDAAKMPCMGVLYQDLAAGAEGLAVTFGKAVGVAANFTAGDVLYVSPTTPGGLTDTKPTSASHLIQNVGILMQAHATNASVKVTGVGRSNDVPNQFSIVGTITAASFIKSGGAADAFLLADGDAESGATARGTLGFDETAVSAGSLWYYDTGTSTWKNTNTALVYDVATGTFKSEADAADSTGLPRLSQLTTAATGKGADLIAYDNSTSSLSATKVGSAIDELSGRKQFTHSAYRSGSFSDGQMIRLYLNTTDNDANFVIPAGQTLKILAAYGRCKSGSTVGKTTWTLGIRTWADQAHTGVNDHVLASGFTNSTSVYINIESQGTLASPLASIVGDDDPVGMVSIQHDNTGGGSSASDKHTVMVYGVFV